MSEKLKRVAVGIYERSGAGGTGSYQVKVRAGGVVDTKTFKFDDRGPVDRRRSAVLRDAKLWQAQAKASAQNHGVALDALTQRSHVDAATLGDWCAQFIADADHTLTSDASQRAAGREVSEKRLDRLRRLAEVPPPFAPLTTPQIIEKKSVRRERDMLVVCLQQYAAGLMRKRPSEVTADDLAALRDECKSRRVPSGARALTDQSINLRLAAIQSVYLRARDVWRHADGSPWWPRDRHTPGRAVARLKNRGRKAVVISAAEWNKIWAQRGGTDTRTLAALMFLRATGARRSEAVRLAWSDVMPPARAGGIWLALLRETKSPTGVAGERTIPIFDNALGALVDAYKIAAKSSSATADDLAAALQMKNVSGLVFNVRADTITQAWERMRKRARVGDRRVHDIRHTRVTEIANSLPLLQAQALSGHKTTAMIARYYHADVEEIGKTLLAVERARQPKAKAKSG